MSVDAAILPPRYARPERIAHGGMGDIYVAEDRQLGRKVAIKVLAERFSSDAEVRERFKREALTAARLSGHPHIVTIFDVGEWQGRPFIVMELFEGGTLADRIHDGRISRGQSFDWLRQAAEALDAAHREGIVHRDVKPANLLFDSRGELNVADFGIARVLDQTTAGMTAPGTVLGTAGYLAPEQASGEEATAASDIYSLGVVAYELVTGRRPFERGSATAEAAAHIHEPVPSASAEVPGIPRTVDAVFERALEKDPSRRHGSAGELVQDLQAAVTAGEQSTGSIPVPPTAPTSALPAPRRGRSWLVPALLALVLLGAGGAVAAALVTDGGGDPRVETTVVTARETITTQGEVSVRTETETVATTVQAEPPPPPPPTPPSPGPPPPPAGSVTPGQARRFTDQAKAANDQGNYAEGERLGRQAIAGLQGTGEVYEAYAYYNYGVSLLGLDRCSEAIDYFDRSEAIQGPRSEITRDRARAERCAETDD